jgi:hypothetical protein
MSHIAVMKFGCHRLTENEGPAHTQMRRAAQYYNALVSIERWRRHGFAAVRSLFVPNLSEMEQAHEQITEWLDEQRDLIKAKRKKASVVSVKPRKIRPTKQVDVTDEKDEIEELQRWRKELAARLKPARAEFQGLIEHAAAEYKLRTSAAPKGDNHAKKRLNAEAWAAMLSEPDWHEAWKGIARIDQAAYELRNWVFGACGLCHGTYTAVREDVGRAGKRPQPRPDGEPRKPKERPSFSRRLYRKIGWQIQGGLTWGDILAGKSSQIRVVERRSARTPTPMGRGGRRNPQNHDAKELAKREREGAGKGNRSRQEYAAIKIRISKIAEDGSAIWATVETFLARPIPEDAVVRWVYIVPREEAGRWTYTLQLTVDTEQPLIVRQRGDGIASVSIRWSRADSSLLVARVNDDEQIVLPKKIITELHHADDLRGSADRYFDDARDALLEWMKSRPTPDWVREAAATAPHWRAHWKLERLAHRWSADLAATGQLTKLWSAWKAARGQDDFHSSFEILSEWLTTQGVADEPTQFIIWLEWWRRKDIHMTQMQTNIRRRALNRRKDFYRCTAASLVTRFARCELKQFSLAAAALRDLPEAEAKELHKAARHQRVQAAPYELKEALRHAFGPDGYSERSGDDETHGTARKVTTPPVSPQNEAWQPTAAE